MNTTDFGNFIASLRKEKGLTQMELAEKLAVTDKAVSRWETGRNYPDIETLKNLADALDVSISELLETKRIPAESIAEASENQIVEQIKTNRKSRKKYRAIIAIALIIALISSYAVLKENGVFDGVIYNKIDCYSNDVLTILNNIDGYIRLRPKADGELIVNDGWLFLNEDKTTNDIYLSGTCKNGRSFYANTLYTESSRYCFIGEFRKNTDPVEGISLNELKSLVSQLDLSEFPTPEKYHLSLFFVEKYENQNLYLNKYQASKTKLIFADGVLQKYTEKTISGDYFRIQLMTVDNGSGTVVADIFCKI